MGWPEAEVTAVVGLAALGGMAEGEGVVETFFLGAIFDFLLRVWLEEEEGVWSVWSNGLGC